MPETKLSTRSFSSSTSSLIAFSRNQSLISTNADSKPAPMLPHVSVNAAATLSHRPLIDWSFWVDPLSRKVGSSATALMMVLITSFARDRARSSSRHSRWPRRSATCARLASGIACIRSKISSINPVGSLAARIEMRPRPPSPSRPDARSRSLARWPCAVRALTSSETKYPTNVPVLLGCKPVEMPAEVKALKSFGLISDALSAPAARLFASTISAASAADSRAATATEFII